MTIDRVTVTITLWQLLHRQVEFKPWTLKVQRCTFAFWLTDE